MKTIFGPFVSGLAGMMLLTGCAVQKGTKELASAPNPIYETAAQIEAMPPCRAKVVRRAPCFLYLTTAAGKGFYLGSPGSEAEVGLFLHTLEDGHGYVFPDAFLYYQRNQPAP